MVFYFSSTATIPPTVLYMGRDKYENEDLIRYGYEEDIWFHVDKLSSAHVYVRLNAGMTMDTMTKELIDDCCQLVKANSIEGNKKNNLHVVFTPWTNLKKTQGMEDGQVGFHKQHLVKRVPVEKRINEIVNRLNKTKTEKIVDFAKDKVTRERQQREEQRHIDAKQRVEAFELEAKKKEQERLLSYADVFDSASKDMKSNRDLSMLDIEEYENSFM